MGNREDDERAREYWEQQSRLPLRQRDRMWWSSVGFSTVVLSAAALAVVVLVALNALGVL